MHESVQLLDTGTQELHGTVMRWHMMVSPSCRIRHLAGVKQRASSQ